jgi:hypothetical protein
MSNSINDTLLNLIIHTSLFYLNCLYNLKQVLAVLTHDTEARNPRDDSQKYSNSTGNWFQFQSNWGKHRETVSDIFDVYIMLREVFARIILRLFRGHGVCFSGEPLRPNALYAHPGLGNVARCWAQRMPMPIGCQFRFFFRSLLLHVISCDVMWQYQTFVQYLFLNLHDVCNMSWFWSHGSQGWCQCPDPRLLLKTPLGISACWPGTGK